MVLLRPEYAGEPADVIISYNATTRSCERGSQWEPALVLLLQLEDYNLQMTVAAQNEVMDACGSQQRWKEALYLGIPVVPFYPFWVLGYIIY